MVLDISLLNFLLSKIGRDRLNSYFDPYKDSLKTYIMPIEVLRPHEGTLDGYIEYIARDIIASGYVKYPIVVDIRTLVILDGHHRVEILRRLGIKYIPVFLVDYLQDYIDVYPLRKDIPVTKHSIIDMAVFKKAIYPPKTSRHIYYGFTVLPTYTPLDHLKTLTVEMSKSDTALNH
ncbi:MAG: ParB N-terminal domain-containing protein [Ignisphaera sp.]|uniref:ParB-like N-terminal domain-containing protein n=1 Tax=Ignisphaera aggregans TaxID=334771 RepID=A0A7J3JR60_9CREN